MDAAGDNMEPATRGLKEEADKTGARDDCGDFCCGVFAFWCGAACVDVCAPCCTTCCV